MLTPSPTPTPSPPPIVDVASEPQPTTEREAAWRFLAWLALAVLIALVAVESSAIASVVKLALFGEDEEKSIDPDEANLDSPVHESHLAGDGG
jgi:hypothetical protein